MPHPPEPLVHRPRLQRLLADGTRRQVTLVSGPPGAGKTTLLTTWLHARPPGRAAWVTVDERDNERGHLARLVVEALVRVGALADPRRSETSPAASGEVMLDVAFEQIMAVDAGCVLVLEDVHELRSAAALRTLAYLVERAPDGLDVVLSTRADPPISQGRLGLDGRLGQIRYADLGFTEDEAAELVAAHGVDLDRSEVRALCVRMEGWAAGLKLAACALQVEDDPHRFVADAAAARAAVSDYLLTEVLLRQDAATRDFLLRTSVAERVTPDLAVALTGDPRSRARLLDLEHRGLFLAKLDGDGTYRYHALLRSLLLARLQQSQPDLVVELHRRVAGWHLAHGQFGDAEQHARSAGDWSLAGQLLLQRWLQGTTTDGDPLADDPVAGVSPAVVLQTPELALVAATQACRWSNRQEADLYRGALDETEASGVLGTWDARRRSVWNTARCLSDLTYGWTFGADARSRTAIEALRGLATSEAWTPRLRQLALLAQAEQDIDGGELDEARRSLEELADEGADAWHRVLAAVTLAVLEAATGDLPAAEARVAAALAAMGERAAKPTVHFAHLATALCAAQRGAQRAETDALAAAGGVLEWSSRSLRCVDRAVRAAANGRAPFFVSLDAETARHPLAERALVALGVLEVVDAGGRPVAVGGPGERALAEMRRQLREQPGDRPGHGVTGWLDGVAPRHPRTLIEAGVLAAIAAHRRGDRASAGHRLGDALDLATATGITAPLLAHGADLKGVLASGVDGLGARTAAAFELLDRVQHTGPQAVVEPLTDREIEVLQHLPTLMSNVEIAEGMHLSVNTVKTHLKAVYRKLGVEGRREAVLRGRELELI